MKEKRDFTAEELLEHFNKDNRMNLSFSDAQELSGNVTEQDFEDFLKDSNNPIGEYEGLTKKMRVKIQEIISSLKEENIKEASESDETEEKDDLDELDGKEQLDAEKKEEVHKKRKQEKSEQTQDEDDKKLEEKAEENNKEEKEAQEVPKKDEYLAKVKKLHEMKIVDYKDQLRKDNTQVDKYFITMMYLQKSINRQRDAFIKEYGIEELAAIENQYLKEELKYEKTLNMRMEKDLSRLRALDQKLDSILDKMQSLQNSLETGSISLEDYNDEINSLEKDKLDTLWQINRLNPELLEEKQENLKTRDMYERKTTTAKIEKERKKEMTSENKAKESALNYSAKKQDGMAEMIHEDMKDVISRDITQKEERLYELRNKLKDVNIETPEGKKQALELIGEIQTLEAQKLSQEKQMQNLEKNMQSDVQSYGDLETAEKEREHVTEEFEEMTDDINPSQISTDLMSQLKSQALEDPSTPEQAEEYLENINEISEDAEKEEKEQTNEENEPPTLWNRRKRPY